MSELDDAPMITQESVPGLLAEAGAARWAVPFTLREAALELVKGATSLGRDVAWETLTASVVRQQSGALVVTISARTCPKSVTGGAGPTTVLSERAGQPGYGGVLT